MYQHQVKRRCRVEILVPVSVASWVRDLVLVAQVMKVRNSAARIASDWVVLTLLALQVVHRQRVVPLDVVPFFFMPPWQTGHRGLLVFSLADPTVGVGSALEHTGVVLSRTLGE